MPAGTSHRYWEIRIAALTARLNFASWLDLAAPALFPVGCAVAIAVYALRRGHGPLWLWVLLTAVPAAGWLGVTLWRVCRNAFSATDARVLLETELGLDAGLTAATSGIAPWPPAVPVGAFLRWRAGGPVAWIAGALALVAIAAWAPLPHGQAGTFVEKPPSLVQAEAMLDALNQAQLVEPRAIEEMQERARELSRRPVDELYGHSALEAADTLRDETAAAVSALSRNLDAASHAMAGADSTTTLESAAGRLAAAINGLRDSPLPLNSEMLARLPARGADLSRLTPEQRNKLAQQLAAAGKRAKGIAGAAGANAPVAQADPSKKYVPGQGADGEPGAGGQGGGEKGAPLTFSSARSDATNGTNTALNPADLSRLALGDKLGTTNGAPEVDTQHAVGPVSAGTLTGPARGGDAVWVDRLTPTERAALKQLYK